MASSASLQCFIPLCVVLLVLCLISPAAAFGAGELPSSSSLHHYAWLHGDVSEVLLQLPVSFLSGQNYAFTKLEREQIYFGNWLRDYSQLIDITSLGIVPEKLLRAVVSILAFLKFNLATGEFDVKADRLGCYRAEEHIDNPRGYALNENDTYIGDAYMNELDQRLRHQVKDEELEIDPETGMKNYIANEKAGSFATSASFIRGRLQVAIEHGRRAHSGDHNAKHEAFRQLGAALHTLEDFAAHSNFTELVLLKRGEKDVFACVGDGSRTTVPKSGERVPPLVTGTFGSLDILASLIGVADDKTAAQNQNSLAGLEQVLAGAGGSGIDLLFKALQTGIATLSSALGAPALGSNLARAKNSAETAQQNPNKYNPKAAGPPGSPEFKRALETLAEGPNSIWSAIEPAFKLHDDVVRWQKENEDLFNIPILSDANKILSENIDKLVYSILAIVLRPAIEVVRTALVEAKDEVEARDRQNNRYVDLYAENSTGSDPSHSVIAKDHFSNVLNAPAGLIATAITNWTTQEVVRCWDDQSRNVDESINRILKVMHHPYFQEGDSDIQTIMSSVVNKWWDERNSSEKDTLRRQLSKDGIRTNANNPANFKRTSGGFATFNGSTPALIKRPEKSIPDEIIKAVGRAAEAIAQDVERVARGAMTVAEEAAKNIEDGLKRALQQKERELAEIQRQVEEQFQRAARELANVPQQFERDIAAPVWNEISSWF